MSTKAEIHVGDVGTIFEMTVLDQDDVVVDISTNDTIEIEFKKPDNTTLVKMAVFVTDGTDGKMKVTSIVGDLDQVGSWVRQGHVKIDANNEWHTNRVAFDVKPVLV